MPRKFHITKKRVAPVVTVEEQQARAKYLRMRQLPGTDYVITDAGLYPVRGSAGLRAAADKALLAELEQSIKEPESK